MRWEYLVEEMVKGRELTNTLTHHGMQGWELVASHQTIRPNDEAYTLIFKRKRV
jgi:hypothetical protein